MKIYALSLGCPKNLVDTERFLADAAGKRWEVVAEPLEADILFLNTCAFLTEAVTESRNFLKELISLKGQFPAKKIYLAGCLVSRFGKVILTEFPEVDRLIYPDEIVDLPNRFLCTPPYYAYLKISEGCNNRCSYCLIPSLRGRLHSYPMERLIAEANSLAAGGVKELNVVAQDTTAYGVDIYGRPLLSDLLKEICRVDGLRWVRLLYTYPTGYNAGLIKVLEKEEKVCHYLDIPFQHASDQILSAMGRRGSQKDYRSLIKTLRSAIPDLTLRTTFIVGFPGETERDFKILLDFVEEIGFEKLGLFAYSPEQGSRAAALPGQVPEDLKEERLERLRRVQEKISRKKLKSFVNRKVEVLVEGADPENGRRSCGRTRYDAPEVDGVVYLNRRTKEGTFATVRITSSSLFDLYGKVLDSE